MMSSVIAVVHSSSHSETEFFFTFASDQLSIIKAVFGNQDGS